MSANPVFCALDTADETAAAALARDLAGLVGGIKLGLEFFTANGPAGVRRVMAGGQPLFLDLKFNDIPNTVAGAVRGIAPLAPAMTTLHALGGSAMMRAAAEAAAEAAARLGTRRPLLLAVTALTSLGTEALAEIGIDRPLPDLVRRLADRAQAAGIDGVVCSAHEVAGLRAQCGPGFKLVVPGIRPAWALETHDQQRVQGPAEALAAGADILVIGRPITAAADPAGAARRLAAEIAEPAR